MWVIFLFLILILVCFTLTKLYSSEQSVLQEEMINIRTTQQSQTQESTGECTLSGPVQSEYDITAAMRGQCHGHLKGVRRQFTRMASLVGASSVAAGSSTLVPGPTPAEETEIPELVYQQVTRMFQLYQQYLQSLVAQVLLDF